MKKVRSSVFETNSSSVHSLVISNSPNRILESLSLAGVFGEYGWGHENLTSPGGKLSYVLTSFAILSDADGKTWDDNKEGVDFYRNRLLNFIPFMWLNEMVKDFTGEEIEIFWGDNEFYNFGYIDHQSREGQFTSEYTEDGWKYRIPDVMVGFWSDDEEEFKLKMKEFIFNDKYHIEIDNDNH